MATIHVSPAPDHFSKLNFHLAHQTNPKFIFEPKETTDKLIWKYLSSFNLLSAFKEIDISELDKISTLEKATHDKNYSEDDLFELYKRFQFNLNQLLNVRDHIQLLSNIEARAFKDRGGIWVIKNNKMTFDKEKKISAIGLRVKKWITYHGMSFNINPDLKYYNSIHSCGLKEYTNTSLNELGIKIDQKEFDEGFKKIFLNKLKTI